MKKKSILLSLSLCATLCACGGKDGASDDLLAYYTLEGDTIPSIEQFINDETGGRLVATLSPDAAQSEEQSGEDGAATEQTASYLSYDYQQFTEGSAASVAESYAALLMEDDISLHSESKDPPSFKGDAGSVTLIRQAVATDGSGAPQQKADAASAPAEDAAAEEEEGGEEAAQSDLLPYSSYEQDSEMQFRVRIDWTPTSCLITLDKTPGQDFITSLRDAGTFLSFSGAKAMMQTVTPAEIGLPGTSMDAFSLKPGPGFVMVDGRACLTMYVYGKNDVGTNSLMGTYFISSDYSYLYRQVGDSSDEVELIEFDTELPEDLPASEGEAVVGTP